MTEHRETALRLTLRAAAVLPLLALLGVSCGGLPPSELFRLSLPVAVADTLPVRATDGAAAPLKGTLGIAQYTTPGIYGDPPIVFRINDNQYGSYSGNRPREWAVPLGDQLGVITERVLSKVPLTGERAVFDPPSRRSQTYVWRGTVREFEEVDRGSQVFAAVRIDARIARADDDSIVWSGTSRAERPVSAANMPGIVQTLSTLADEVVTDLATRARQELSARRP